MRKRERHWVPSHIFHRRKSSGKIGRGIFISLARSPDQFFNRGMGFGRPGRLRHIEDDIRWWSNGHERIPISLVTLEGLRSTLPLPDAPTLGLRFAGLGKLPCFLAMRSLCLPRFNNTLDHS